MRRLTSAAASLFHTAFAPARSGERPSSSAAETVYWSTSWPAAVSSSRSWARTSMAPPLAAWWLCSCRTLTSRPPVRAGGGRFLEPRRPRLRKQRPDPAQVIGEKRLELSARLPGERVAAEHPAPHGFAEPVAGHALHRGP